MLFDVSGDRNLISCFFIPTCFLADCVLFLCLSMDLATSKTDGLNARQKAFCCEYVIDWNATQAAIRAGYSAKTANRIGSLLLTKIDISSEVKRLTDELLGTHKAHLEYKVLSELQAIAFTKITDAVKVSNGSVVVTDTDDMPENAKRALEEISETTSKDGGSIKVKMHSKPKALELLGKYVGMWEDKLIIGGTLGVGGLDMSPEERKIRYEEILATADARKTKKS